MCSDHRFGGLETLSSQNNEEREKETNPRLHPEALVAAFRQSGSQSPDSRLVGDWVLSSPCTRGRGRGRWWGCGFPQTGAWLPVRVEVWLPTVVGVAQVTRQPWVRGMALFISLFSSMAKSRNEQQKREIPGGTAA